MVRRRHSVTVNGITFEAQHGAVLLDAALGSGIALAHDCRAGHCGTCCVRLIAGEVGGGAGAEPGVVHACQSRIVGDVVIEAGRRPSTRSVSGIVTSLRPLSPEVMEVGLSTGRAFPYLPGQYAQVQFKGFPSRPFSITHPVAGPAGDRTVWFHVRHMPGGRVSSELARQIKPGHRVALSGPFGSAHFRAEQRNRLLLIGTSTGFAPIWSIAVAALRENPQRHIMVITGGRSTTALYMGPALARLARFPNVVVVPVCSSPQTTFSGVYPGRPTDYIPQLVASDIVYACGAPAMVEAVKSIATRYGAACLADPFVTAAGPSDVTATGSATLRSRGGAAIRRFSGQFFERADAETAQTPHTSAAAESTRGHHSSYRA